LLIFFISCTKQEVQPPYNENKKKDSLHTFNLSEGQKKVLEGAKKCLNARFSYDMTMGYYVLKYSDGENTGAKVFPNGDIDPATGVCTEVTIRALRWGGVCDLQKEINDDLRFHFSDYPMERWDAKSPDPNIDQRRVPVQMVWFQRHWREITGNDFEPGDIVAWDMDQDSWGDHIGIVSDKFENGKPFLIHNFPSPGYVAEEDVLNRWNIIGHYRIKK